MKDPTASMDDLAFYMDDRSLADTAATIEPTLLYGGSKAAAGAWIGLTGIVGGAFGGVTLSPAIRQPLAFVAYLIARSTHIPACGSGSRPSVSRRRCLRQPQSSRQTSFSAATKTRSPQHSMRTTAVRSRWTREHQILRDRGQRLSQLAAVTAPAPEQLFERAELTHREGHEQDALDLYTSAQMRGHAAAGLAAGRLLLRRNDAAGMALVDAAMAAEPAHVEDGCSAVVEFLERRNRFVDAHPYRVRQSRQGTHNRMAAPERNEVTATDRFAPGSHQEIDVPALARTLGSEPAVLRAWLAAKQLRYSPGLQPCSGRSGQGRPTTRPGGATTSSLRIARRRIDRGAGPARSPARGRARQRRRDGHLCPLCCLTAVRGRRMGSLRRVMMSLRIVRLGSPRAPGEGLRIGTVRRPPRGVPKTEFAARDYYDVWLPDVAPSEALVKQAQEAQTDREWLVFARRYRAEMRGPAAGRLLDLLAALSHVTDFSVGCYCADERRCHRSVLRTLLRERGARMTDATRI